jgi:SM-20-related protein
VERLSSQEIETLGEKGFVVGEGFLGASLASTAHAKAAEYRAAGKLTRAGIRRGADHRLDEAVRGDSIAWLEMHSDFNDVWQRFEELRLQLNELAFLGLRRTELQLAHYPATGAGYQRHRDAFTGQDNRRITAIVYLNPTWQPEHGGQLTLFVDPLQALEPRLDTFVIFRSELIEHAVQPSHADRFAITAWYSAS